MRPASSRSSGPSGVGKTSLLRAGLTPALARRGVAAVTLGSYHDLERELVRATSRLGIAPPVPGQDPADYLGGVAREAKGGLVLILDHLEEALGRRADEARPTSSRSPRGCVEEGGPLLRLVLSIDEAAFARLETIDAGARRAKLGARVIDDAAAARRRRGSPTSSRSSAVQSGTPFENGLAAAVAADLCRGGPCRAIDLQLAVRAIVDLRLGVAAALPAERRRRRCCRRSGSPTCAAEVGRRDRAPGAARRERAEASVTAADLGGSRARGSRSRRGGAGGAARARAAGRAAHAAGTEVFALAHPALRETGARLRDRRPGARRGRAPRADRRRLATGERLRVPRALRRQPPPARRRCTRRGAPGGPPRPRRRGAAARPRRRAWSCWWWWRSYADSRRSYTLALDPPDAGGAARRRPARAAPTLAFLNFLPNHPPLGSIIADTGYTAAGLGRARPSPASPPAARSRHARRAAAAGRTAAAHVPGWLREVLNGLRPVPRGIAKALLGDPDGVVALKQAFSDPAARGEILSALAVIGRGGAGEDEILAGALADQRARDPPPRRRGRGGDSPPAGGRASRRPPGDGRQAPSAHAATLRAALADRSADVRAAVLQEAPTLPSAEAAGIVTLALRDPDPTLRRRAEEATAALAERAPAAVVDALVDLLAERRRGRAARGAGAVRIDRRPGAGRVRAGARRGS